MSELRSVNFTPRPTDYIPCILSGYFTFMDYTLSSYLLIDELGLEYPGRLAASAANLPGDLSHGVCCLHSIGIVD